MFVVFEGIDGSGKTTVSGRVAKALRQRGIAVQHFREGGSFASPLVNRLREFGKDPRNLAFEPLPELLFYLAREAQLADELVRPALAGGGLVFADRYLHSFENLSVHGRGMDPARVKPILDAVADGLWPDVVILLDVDPHLARARRQVSKLSAPADKPAGGGSRKGLTGIGMQHRMQAGYRQMAAADPDRWLVLDNRSATLDELVAAATETVAALVAGARAADAVEVGRKRLLARPAPTVEAAPESLDEAPARFFRQIARRAEAEPAVAAYLLSGVRHDQAYDWLDRLSDQAPDVVADGLSGDPSERAWRLRERLADRTPHRVARSVDGLLVEGPRADAMRERLAERAAISVLATLDGNDGDVAWRLRDRFAAEHPAQVVASLKRLDTPRAWAIRERFLAERGGEDGFAGDALALAPLIVSLRGVGSDRAWALRRLAGEPLPADVLTSLAGLTDDESWEWRERHAPRAGKLVFRTIHGDASERAFRLRERFADTVKEAIDSLADLDGEAAWAIRERVADRWPSTVVKSLGPLGHAGRGRALAERLFLAHPDNPSLLKHAAALVLGSGAS